MVEKQKSIDTREKIDYKSWAYVVWDSLSVWITSWVDVKKTVSSWKQTSWMLEEVQKNIADIKTKKVLFFLWWTNDIASWVSENTTIENIRKIAELAEKNQVKFVPWTIPNMWKFKNDKQVQAKIEKVNNFIKSNFPNFIDYNSITKNFNQADWVHFDWNWYNQMKTAQETKYAELVSWNIDVNSWEKKTWDKNLDDIQNIINSLNSSTENFQKNISKVFSWEMTKEQKSKMNEIISSKRDLVEEFQKIYKDLSNSKYELLTKNKELNSYQSNKLENVNEKISKEYNDLQNKISDLEKRILELDEQQSILLKDFRLIKNWNWINKNLDQKEIDSMLEVTAIEFLQKPFLERLKYVTIWNINSEDVKNGKVKDLEINFSFNWRFNRSLYLSTTAWMILPNEVRQVSVNWVTYSRSPNSLKWEFFDEKGKRLIIKDETKINILTLESTDNLNKKFESKLDLSNFKDEVWREIAIEAESRWVPLEIASWLFFGELKKMENPSVRKAVMEDLFIELDRKKTEYLLKTSKNPIDWNWKFSLEFLSYLFEYDDETYVKTAKNYGYKDEQVKQTEAERRVRIMKYDWNLDLDKFASLNISKEEVERIRKIRRFTPNSQDAVTLFRIATKSAWLPESWATSNDLHYILGKESRWWVVWILNYTIKWMSLERFKTLAVNSKADNPIWAKSTASWLWQLLLSNVDKYYPSWRRWIWDPIEEAIWFMRYIKDRYWSPEVARSVYGKKWTYVHAVTGKKMSKTFREGY